MKSILLHVHEDDVFEDRLQVALDLCRALDAHLTCIHVTPLTSYMPYDGVAGSSVQSIVLEELRAQQERIADKLEQRMEHEDVRWDWVAADGDVAQKIVEASALCDLIVLGQFSLQDQSANPTLPIVGDIALRAGCPVLVVPKGVHKFAPGEPVVVGWNGSPEAAHAVRSALGILKLASSVHLVSIGDDDAEFPQVEANTYLSRHDVRSDIHKLKGSQRSAATLLHDFAVEHGANCLVIGAYGHSRLREMLLGGATRSLLAKSKIPLLLNH